LLRLRSLYHTLFTIVVDVVVVAAAIVVVVYTIVPLRIRNIIL
jgi:hypothetical protein